jgi:hypothetical protein
MPERIKIMQECQVAYHALPVALRKWVPHCVRALVKIALSSRQMAGAFACLDLSSLIQILSFLLKMMEFMIVNQLYMRVALLEVLGIRLGIVCPQERTAILLVPMVVVS